MNPQALFRPTCPLCAFSCSAGFIHHQTYAWHRDALAKGIAIHSRNETQEEIDSRFPAICYDIYPTYITHS